MEKIIKEFNVYTITELKEMFPEGYEHAIEKEADDWSETGFSFECTDFIESMEAIIENELGCDIRDWSISLWDRSDINVNIEGYMELSNNERKALISRFKAMLPDEATIYDFTGVYTDDYFFRGLQDYNENTEELSYNNFHKAIVSAAYYAISSFSSDMEKTYQDKEYHESNLEANDCLFTEDGKPYYK